MTFLRNPSDFSAVLRERRLDFTPVASSVMVDAFGIGMDPFNHPGYKQWTATSPGQYATLRGAKLAPLMSHIYLQLGDSLTRQERQRGIALAGWVEVEGGGLSSNRHPNPNPNPRWMTSTTWSGM